MSNREAPAAVVVSSSERGDRKLVVQYKALDELQPYKGNPRKHPQAQIDQIIRSIQTFGFTNPLLVDSKGQILAGHGRYIAAQQMKLAKVPIIVLEGLSAKEKRALVIADNQISANSGWDKELLAQELNALRGADFDLDVLGFDDQALNGLLDNSAA